MLNVVLTLDYEIHGNGQGSPFALMVEPTDRLLRLCDEYGAKLTIMADAAEILRFRQHRETHDRDRFDYDAIAEQLERAIGSGHDVQLHLHSSYFNATLVGQRWRQDWTEYDFARLPFARMNWMLRTGKQFLEELLAPFSPGYRCIAFRAANWSMSPSRDAVRALIANGFTMDSSVFKYGRREGRVAFDYSNAQSALVPWPVSADDVCVRDERGLLWEAPIYAERRRLGAFMTFARVQRAIGGWRHRMDDGAAAPAEGVVSLTGSPANSTAGHHRRWPAALFDRHAWKADFNQCTGRQLIAAMQRAAQRYDPAGLRRLPFILIGHSKLSTPRNEDTLRRFLAHAASEPQRYGFGTLSSFAPRVAVKETA